MKYKTEYAVRRAGKVWCNCKTKEEALKIAETKNRITVDTDISPFTAETRVVSEWTLLEQ